MSIFKIDKFIVPQQALAEFTQAVRATHQFLEGQPGLVQQFVLEKEAGSGEFNVVTVVQWKSQSALDAAKTAVQAHHLRSGFDAAALRERLGIRADLANYRALSLTEDT